MTEETSRRIRNGLIALAAVILGVGLYLGNYTRTHSTNLQSVADQSLPLEVALNNGKPTVLEFYADWCTTCQAMAPMMADLKENLGGEINFVMLNVDNPKWLPELEQYQVNGIPHFEFMDAQGHSQGRIIGDQPKPVMRSNLVALKEGGSLQAQKIGTVSSFATPIDEKESPSQPGPRSHG